LIDWRLETIGFQIFCSTHISLAHQYCILKLKIMDYKFLIYISCNRNTNVQFKYAFFCALNFFGFQTGKLESVSWAITTSCSCFTVCKDSYSAVNLYFSTHIKWINFSYHTQWAFSETICYKCFEFYFFIFLFF